MKNRSAAHAAYPIPYYKVYRAFCGSVPSTILFVRLEFWSSRYPDGFWKYMKPPQKRDEQFRPGTSWIEELGFSVDEFRTAFDHIGIRYRTKHTYEAVPEPFKDEKGWEALYCSYVDRGNDRTHYLRNHELVDRLLDEANSGVVGKWTLPSSRKWRLSTHKNGDSPPHDVNGDSPSHDKGSTHEDHEKTPHATVDVLVSTILTACKLNPDSKDLPKRTREDVETVYSWLRKKYQQKDLATVAAWVEAFDQWRRTPAAWESKTQPYWGGGTLRPLWIQEHWERFRLAIQKQK